MPFLNGSKNTAECGWGAVSYMPLISPQSLCPNQVSENGNRLPGCTLKFLSKNSEEKTAWSGAPEEEPQQSIIGGIAPMKLEKGVSRNEGITQSHKG
jgi:hypothetical protein